jgi:hypothetical protein
MKNNFYKTETLEELDSLIRKLDLRAMDVAVIGAKKRSVLKHYVIFLGRDKTGFPLFIANYPSPNGTSTVQLVSRNDLLFYEELMTLKEIRSFQGSDSERKEAVNRAIKQLNKEQYNFVFNNCEHFANYVQFNKASSKQTEVACVGAASIGAILTIFSKNDLTRSVGAILILLALLILLIEKSESRSFS